MLIGLQTSLYYIDGGERLRQILGEEPLLPLTEWVVSHSTPLSPKEMDNVSTRVPTKAQTDK